MFSLPACVVKYMCVRACPLRIDHNAQLARRERPECVGVVRSGAPSLSTFSTIGSFLLFLPLVLPCFPLCLPLSWSHFGMCFRLSAWFVQTRAVPRFLPRQLYKHKEIWEEKREIEIKWRLPGTAEMKVLDKPKDKNANIFTQSVLAGWTNSQPAKPHYKCENKR